jgi:hypothetical protein
VSAGIDPEPAPPPPPSGNACITDDDCRAVPDYCSGGCDCKALSSFQPDPSCKEPVECLRNPCGDQKALCKSGKCALADGQESVAPPPSESCPRSACRFQPGLVTPFCANGSKAGGPSCVRTPSGCAWKFTLCPSPAPDDEVQ